MAPPLLLESFATIRNQEVRKTCKAGLFDLPAGRPDRMIAGSIVLYVGLGIVIGITVWDH
jgi:hypothetical protein